MSVENPFPRRKPATASATVENMMDGLIEHIEVFLDALTDFANRTRWSPADDDAPVEHERRMATRQYGPGGDWTDEEIRYAHAAAVMHTVVAAQHLEGVNELLRTREVMFTLAPLIRAVMENSGFVHWLVYPGNDYPEWNVRDRVARVHLARIADRTRAATTAKLLENPDLEALVLRKKHLRRTRLPELFYPSEIAVNKRGDITLRSNHSVPGVSSLVTTWLERTQLTSSNAGGMYAVLSNATHPTFHFIAEFVDVQDDGNTRFQLDDPSYIFRIVKAGILSAGLSWQLVLAYLGHPQDLPQRLMHNLQDDPRFSCL